MKTLSPNSKVFAFNNKQMSREEFTLICRATFAREQFEDIFIYVGGGRRQWSTYELQSMRGVGVGAVKRFQAAVDALPSIRPVEFNPAGHMELVH